MRAKITHKNRKNNKFHCLISCALDSFIPFFSYICSNFWSSKSWIRIRIRIHLKCWTASRIRNTEKKLEMLN
jgi:hypothetical protein